MTRVMSIARSRPPTYSHEDSDSSQLTTVVTSVTEGKDASHHVAYPATESKRERSVDRDLICPSTYLKEGRVDGKGCTYKIMEIAIKCACRHCLS